METRLFIIGVIMLIWALAAKYLRKKGKLKNKYIFTALHVIFTATVTFLAFWLYDFVSTGGDAAALAQVGAGKRIFQTAALIALSVWAALAAWRAKEGKINAIFDKDYEWADTIYFSALLAAFVMFFFIQAFKIPSASMRYTLIEGDHLFVNKAVYGFRIPLTQKRFWQFSEIKRGDVIVFAFPAKTKEQKNCGGPQWGRDYVKRVIALPGETVEIKDAKVYVNGSPLPEEPYEVYDADQRYSFTPVDAQAAYQQKWEDMTLENYYGILLRDQFGPVTVPENTYFAMGDNRDNSCDSRFWGPVPREAIKGKAWFIHFPFKRMGMIK